MGFEAQVVVAIAKRVLIKVPTAHSGEVAAARRLELAPGVVVENQPHGIEPAVLRPSGCLQPQGALPEMVIDANEIQIAVKGVPAPTPGMHIADHRHAEQLIPKQVLAAVVGEGLNHGRQGCRSCLFVLARKCVSGGV